MPKPPELTHDHLQWTQQHVLYGSVRAGSRLLVLIVQPLGPEGDCGSSLAVGLAIESSTKVAGLEGAFADHSHHIVVECDGAEVVRDACLGYARRWVEARRAGGPGADSCDCAEISLD